MCCFFNVWLLNVFMLLTLFQLLSHFGNNNSFILISKNMYFVYNDTPTHLCQLDAQWSNFFVIFISHKNLATVFLFLQNALDTIILSMYYLFIIDVLCIIYVYWIFGIMKFLFIFITTELQKWLYHLLYHALEEYI